MYGHSKDETILKNGAQDRCSISTEQCIDEPQYSKWASGLYVIVKAR